MSDRSWRDFFESRSFYEYLNFSQKLPLRYAAHRSYNFQSSAYVPDNEPEETRWPRRHRRRRAGFYWCCCCKIFTLIVVTMALLGLIVGLSYYFSKKDKSQRDGWSNTTNATSPASNWTYPTISWNPFTNGSILLWTTTHQPINETTTAEDRSQMPTKPRETMNTISGTTVPMSETRTTTTKNPLNNFTTNVSDNETTHGNFPSTSDISTLSIGPLSTDVKDQSTVSDEGTTLETTSRGEGEEGEESTTPLPWMNISSTLITDDFTDTEEMSTPEPWLNISTSTSLDGFTDTGSGLSEDE